MKRALKTLSEIQQSNQNDQKPALPVGLALNSLVLGGSDDYVNRVRFWNDTNDVATQCSSEDFTKTFKNFESTKGGKELKNSPKNFRISSPPPSGSLERRRSRTSSLDRVDETEEEDESEDKSEVRSIEENENGNSRFNSPNAEDSHPVWLVVLVWHVTFVVFSINQILVYTYFT